MRFIFFPCRVAIRCASLICIFHWHQFNLESTNDIFHTNKIITFLNYGAIIRATTMPVYGLSRCRFYFDVFFFFPGDFFFLYCCFARRAYKKGGDLQPSVVHVQIWSGYVRSPNTARESRCLAFGQ